MRSKRPSLIGLVLVLASCSHGPPSASPPDPTSGRQPSPRSSGSVLTQKTAPISKPAKKAAGGSTPKVTRNNTPPKKGAPSSFVMPRFSRVIVIVMENKEYETVIGSDRAPYVNSLAARYALATDFFGVAHPSLPNYIAMTSGSTNGISSNCTDCHVDAPNLVTQLERAGISWKAYIEGLPEPCSNVAESGTYRKKHNPFMYYDDITNDPARCNKVVPLTQLDTDMNSNSLPQFVWITPDMCHDMHDCKVSEGDAWLSNFVPPLLATLGPEGVLFLTFDEGTTNAGCCQYASGGHVPTVVAGPAARARTESSAPLDLYSILRTIEDSWRLGRLGHAGCSCTEDMRTLLDSA